MKERRLARIEIDESCPLDKFELTMKIKNRIDGSSHVNFKNVAIETVSQGSISSGSFIPNNNIVIVLSCDAFKETSPAQEIPLIDVELDIDMIKNGKIIRYSVNFPNIDDVLDNGAVYTGNTQKNRYGYSAPSSSVSSLQDEINTLHKCISENQDEIGKVKLNTSCNHEWKTVQGLIKDYTDCTKCGMKKEDYEEAQVTPDIPEFWDEQVIPTTNGGKIIICGTPKKEDKLRGLTPSALIIDDEYMWGF